jgi:hypothetical protein
MLEKKHSRQNFIGFYFLQKHLSITEHRSRMVFDPLVQHIHEDLLRQREKEREKIIHL